MRVTTRLLSIVLTLTTPAVAQPTGQMDSSTECQAEKAAIDRDMELARSKGQMLRRRQLAEALATLQARCETLAPEQSRAANIESLEKEIRELRKELDHAEEQLRKLKSEAP
jgi:chaperonin cofactor prefoldin